MILALLLFGTQQSPPIHELLSPELAVERMSKCGLGRPVARYDRESKIEILVLRRPVRARDDQLACLDKASGYLDVRLSLALQWRFNAIRDARLKAYFRDKGRAWLEAHGLLERLPEYRPGNGAAYVQAIEQLCGPEASGAFRATDGGYGFSPEWMKRNEGHQFADEPTTCLTYALMASGFPPGFVGNESAAP